MQQQCAYLVYYVEQKECAEIRSFLSRCRDLLNVSPNSNVWSPLDLAIGCGRVDVAQCIVDLGGRINPRLYHNKRTMTPIHKLCMMVVESIAMIEWLLEKENCGKPILPSSVFYAPTRMGWTPLDYAIAYNTLSVVKFLVEKMGAFVNHTIYHDRMNYTPLYYLVEVEHIGEGRHNHLIFKWIIENNIIPSTTLNNQCIDAFHNYTLLDMAIFKIDFDIARVLWENGARPNTKMYSGRNKWNVLQPIIYKGHVEMLEWIEEQGIVGPDIFVGESGSYHLRYAEIHKQTRIVDFLRKRGAVPLIDSTE